MDQRTVQMLFSLLRSAICGTELAEGERDICSPEMLSDVLKISSKHDVIHLSALGIGQNGLAAQNQDDVERCTLKAVYRYERIKREYDNLCMVLEQNKISFLPLKGAVIRQYYPESWMRTSCDIDILVHKEDIERAKSVLVENYGYEFRGQGSHDISLFGKANVHVELHYELVEEKIAKEAVKILKTVWEVSNVRDGYSYWYEMSDEMFYFYHIAHMAKHFEYGGCGIRPFIDLWILDRIHGANEEKRDALLQDGNLLKFANTSRKLSRIWFSGEKHDSVSKQMEEYILCGGVYGNNENRIAVQQQKKGGKIKYALSKIFISYDSIKFQYPILQKYKWLTPIMEVRRWFKLIFCGHAKRVMNELKLNQTIPSDKAESTKAFLKNVGL